MESFPLADDQVAVSWCQSPRYDLFNVQAQWDPEEQREGDLIKWMVRRWRSLRFIERAFSLFPLVCGLLFAYWSPQVLAPTAILSGFIAGVMSFQLGRSGYRSELPVSESTAGVEEVLVNVIFQRDGTILGEDFGSMVLVDGWLVFTGHRTDFSFRHHHVYTATTTQTYDLLSFTKRYWERLTIKGTRRAVLVRAETDDAKLAEILRQWRDPKWMNVGEATLPPDTPHEDAFLLALASIIEDVALALCVVFLFWPVSLEPTLNWAGILIALMLLNKARECVIHYRKLRQFQSNALPSGPKSLGGS